MTDRRTQVSFSLELEVTDLETLYKAATERALADGMSTEDAREFLTEDDGEGTDCAISARRCVQMLLDPGSMPGVEIQDSCAEEIR